MNAHGTIYRGAPTKGPPDVENPFVHFWNLGFKTLLPLIPVDAELTGNVSRKPEQRLSVVGKAPGRKHSDGKWGLLEGWPTYQANEDDLKQWFRDGANVGFRIPDDMIAIDIDASDPNTAQEIEKSAIEAFGSSPVRVGNSPRRMLFYRTGESFKYSSIKFEGPNGSEKVEVLAPGKQVVLYGMHPKTRRKYEWPVKPIARAALCVISKPAFDGWFSQLKTSLPAAVEHREGNRPDRERIDQKALVGDLDLVRRAVNSLPNNRDIFPDRLDYIGVGAAIKAALPFDQEEAYELWCNWAERDNGGVPSDWPSDWAGLKRPFEVGAQYIYNLSDQHSGGAFSLAQVHFENLDLLADQDLFSVPGQTPSAAGVRFRLLTDEEIENRPPPKWLINRYLPERSLGFLYSEPGAGKSFVALDLSLSIASGQPDWHGDSIAADGGAVIYIAGEGSYGFRNRIRAWKKARGIPGKISNFRMIEQTVNFMSPADVSGLLETLKAERARSGLRPVLIVVDTISRALPGADENLQKEMTLFIQACDAIRETQGCAVLGVHHAGKKGDMRGSTVLLGAGDFVFHLARKKGAATGLLSCQKMKDGPDGWEDVLRFDPVPLDGGETSLVIERLDTSVGPSITLNPELTSQIIAAMASAWEEGRPWSKAPQAKDRNALRILMGDYGFDAVKAEETLSVWEASGLIEYKQLSAKRRVMGFYVRGDYGQSVQNNDIFG